MPRALLFICSLWEPDSQQIAGVWCDLAAALFRRRKEGGDEKILLKRKEKKW